MTDTRAPGNDLPTALCAIGVFAAVAAMAVLLFSPAATVGDPTAVESSLAAQVDSVVPPEVPGTASNLEESNDPFPANTVNRLEDLTRTNDVVPVRLQIEALGVDARIDPYGIDASGQMDVPMNVRDVGWYRHGPIPGESGSAVLAAHVDLVGEGPGVFFDLRTLVPGSRVSITFSDDTEQWFTTLARTTYEKEELPLDTIFSRSGSPVLTLITCGGGFNRSVQRYDSNVVVYAVPIAPPVSDETPA